ncbi:nicotinate-nucleotide adenylyltransferase [Maridesulfovibrio zosterae]|uniref:nicotinate-nucleotide adenylyltransferase n=1 Tax=Maridesulfovibrio zosterae TaxID=82171 RepID=UPI00042A85BE|nr:nicotinate-nucleotide adenylyltransferase [Maridesulfovibrio zosterae]
MKIGLFGGSFNPVHSTHIDVANSVMQRLGLDKVLLVPAGNPYHKEQEDMLPEDLRFELVKAAVEGESGLEVSDIDMGAKGPTYTIDTLRESARRYPDDEFYFIMGQDSFETLATWKDWQMIPKLTNIVAVSRYEADSGEMSQLLKSLFSDLMQTGKDVWRVEGGKSIYIIGDLDFVISSTLVREAWKKGKDILNYVPLAVADSVLRNSKIIKEHWG